LLQRVFASGCFLAVASYNFLLLFAAVAAAAAANGDADM